MNSAYIQGFELVLVLQYSPDASILSFCTLENLLTFSCALVTSYWEPQVEHRTISHPNWKVLHAYKRITTIPERGKFNLKKKVISSSSSFSITLNAKKSFHHKYAKNQIKFGRCTWILSLTANPRWENYSLLFSW